MSEPQGPGLGGVTPRAGGTLSLRVLVVSDVLKRSLNAAPPRPCPHGWLSLDGPTAATCPPRSPHAHPQHRAPRHSHAPIPANISANRGSLSWEKIASAFSTDFPDSCTPAGRLGTGTCLHVKRNSTTCVRHSVYGRHCHPVPVLDTLPGSCRGPRLHGGGGWRAFLSTKARKRRVGRQLEVTERTTGSERGK